ncbi:hypothetical protein BSKO_08670 [Bryopsis sp. KO-2023]|nr:hypothetical protein BSKO_08670 [Bryopsis sp. KO-2023]
MASVQMTKSIFGRPVGVSALPGRLANASNNTVSKVTCSVKGKVCHAEIVAGDADNATTMVDKFETAYRRSNVFHEFRRRRQFECKQDRLKRKNRELAFKKKQIYFSTFEDSAQGGLSVPPFADLYDDGEDDLFGEGGFFNNTKNTKKGGNRRQQNRRR